LGRGLFAVPRVKVELPKVVRVLPRFYTDSFAANRALKHTFFVSTAIVVCSVVFAKVEFAVFT